uniref:Uncharacterized protein n=1 Tax=Timema shepardi TaxID=629360 RepID=A0A7R9G2X4_TIMSH|nr:unnamed protein product [Timema shepardi]
MIRGETGGGHAATDVDKGGAGSGIPERWFTPTFLGNQQQSVSPQVFPLPPKIPATALSLHSRGIPFALSISATAPIVLSVCLPLLPLSSQDVCHCSHCPLRMSATAPIVLSVCLPLLPLSSQYVCHCSHCPPRMSATAPIVLSGCLPLLPLSSGCLPLLPLFSTQFTNIESYLTRVYFQTYSKQRSHLTSPSGQQPTRPSLLKRKRKNTDDENSENNPPPNHQAQQCILHKTAPTTLSTAWAAPHFMFSELSVTSSPLYSAPMRTPLSIGSLGGHYISCSHASMRTSIEQGQAAVEGAILSNILALPAYHFPPTYRVSCCRDNHPTSHYNSRCLPPTVTHIPGTIGLSPTVTHVAGTITQSPIVAHVAGTITQSPTVTHVARTITLPPTVTHVARTITLPSIATHIAGTITLSPTATYVVPHCFSQPCIFPAHSHRPLQPPPFCLDRPQSMFSEPSVTLLPL